jgi:hypothetical protein
MSAAAIAAASQVPVPGSASLRPRSRRTAVAWSWLISAAIAIACGATVLWPSAAWAACTPATGSNITVTCSGATLNQGPEINTGYGDSTQDGLTLNVQSAASVIGTSIGIDVNDNNTINNLGTITTQGSGGIGDVFGITANGSLTVNNSGTIGRADITDFIFDEAGINENNTGLSVLNNAGGVIEGTYGILGVGTGTVVNSGLINAIGDGGDGINYASNNTSSVSVTNKASGTITGDESAINANSATVANYGTISAPTLFGTAILANTLTLTNYASGTISGDGGAISGSMTPNLTITNYGTITGGIDSAQGAISGSVVNVTNSGTISIASGSGGPAISMVSGSVINNAGGSIIGDYEAIATSGNTSIFDAGTISANSGPAIFFESVGSGGAGGNTLTLGPGFVINGTALGSGSDTLQLGGTGSGTFDLSNIGSTDQYQGFTTFNVVSATWTANGTFSQSQAVER